MPTRSFLALVLLALALGGAAPLDAQRRVRPRFPTAYAARLVRARPASVPADTGVAADSTGDAAGAFFGAVIASGFGSPIGVLTGALTAAALRINGDDEPGLALAVILPQSALLAGAGGCAVYHASASCRPIFVASALGAAGGALLVSTLPYNSNGGVVALSYLGVHTLTIAVAGALARHAAATSAQRGLKAAP